MKKIFNCKNSLNSTRISNDKLLIIGAISFIKYFCEINDALITDSDPLH